MPILLALLCLVAAACGGGRDAPAIDTLLPVLAHVTPTTARIGWRTPEALAGSVAFQTIGGATEVVDRPPASEQDVLLEGLLPGTTYRYEVLVGGHALGEAATFHTPTGAPDEGLRFDVAGDTGTGLPPALTLFGNVAADAPDLVWICGDCAYTSGTREEVRRGFSDPLATLRRHTPLYAVLGNHDVQTEGGQPLLEAVFLPTNAATGTERFFAFERADCLFVGLDSTPLLGMGSTQLEWLAAVLRASSAHWSFVFLHHTTYSSSRHGSSATLQASLAPVVQAEGVDVVFCGHDHDYERTFPLTDGTPSGAAADPDYVDPAGPIWVVSGGGTTLYESGTSDFTAFSVSIHHHVRVHVTGSRVDLEAVDAARAVFDRMSITKSP